MLHENTDQTPVLPGRRGQQKGPRDGGGLPFPRQMRLRRGKHVLLRAFGCAAELGWHEQVAETMASAQ